ncbi:hypothetical protein TMatcc_008451 [Talaromyces marneffei ATCC 18224]|uniref:DUF167 domain protein n=2 Tax=Talaromyces marneffei TaxID=37727 RepID=B6QLZ4_TALMQ|nr:uncharacterized protein EYB26_007789 [Talaromyces marneffei]EEA22121.1 DUF167 domain protein [Talaromyces marneffei ATCC 18224]KAE8550423.1 hypothetical protein EYB25_006649 [Talaromyces marneffei]QGA20089.1 hypothetical protein EYB26_007789 [Talaromyces marneffei]
MNETPKLLRLTSIARKNKNALYSLLIRCHVTPGSRGFQGVKKICDEQVYIHVASAPRKGEANAAVVKVLSEVLGIPKSDITIMGKHRDKVGQVNGIEIGKLSEEAYLSKVRQKLADACHDKEEE